MRVTTATQEATRQRIRESARGLFQSQGFDATTTRDIAREAEIAAGTMFNYYASKEAIVLEFVGEALEEAEAVFQQRVRDGMSLSEELFLLIANGLRQLRALRAFMRPALEIGLSPAADQGEEGDAIRASHLETVAGILQKHQPGEPATAVQLQMYWMLYTGLLASWAGDSSPKQEDTLALLDHALQMYAQWWAGNSIS
jgi:AcrR family transcriptional regulator